MSRWIASYPIPVDSFISGVKYAESALIQIGYDIWIFTSVSDYDFDEIVELFVFRPEANKIISDTFLPNVLGQVSSVNMVNGTLYLYSNLPDEASVIYKMDIKTMETEEIMTFNDACQSNPAQIIDDHMYIWQFDWDEYVYDLIDINLSTETATTFPNLVDSDEESEEPELIAKNGKLYLLELSREPKIRKISLINEGRLELLEEDTYSAGYWFDRSNCIDGTMMFEQEENGKQMINIETFDFTINKWTRTVIDKPWKYHNMNDKICTFLENDDYIYMVTKKCSKLKVDLRIMEKSAKLENLCLQQFVDELVECEGTDELENIKQKLPIGLRSRLDNLYNFTKSENIAAFELLLENMQREAFRDGMLQLVNDGVLENDFIRVMETHYRMKEWMQ